MNPRSTRSRIGLGALLIAGALLTLAGCAAPVASPTGSASGGSSTGSVDADRDAYDLKMAACLREKGFDIADPQPGKGITESSPEIDAAASDCRTDIGDLPTTMTAADSAAVQATYLEWAACFRERGYDVADPAADQAFAIPENASDSDIAACTAVTG